jgi:anti-anti-sigma regulatory factor
MNFNIEKTEHYALISPTQQSFNSEVAIPLEKAIVGLYREGFINMLIDFSKITEIDEIGLNLLRKATKVCKSEQGIFVVCTKNDDLIDTIDEFKIPEILILPSTDEGIDAVFMNELENDFREEEDDEFGLSEEDGFQEEKY